MPFLRLYSHNPSYQKNVAKIGHWPKFILTIGLVVQPLDSLATPSDLPNFQVVHRYLLRGGQPSEAGLRTLKSMGVDVIIDLRAPTKQAQQEKQEAIGLGLKYINLPMSSRAPTEEQVESFLAAVDSQASLQKATSSQTNAGKFPHALFVHCAHGSDRTGCMVGIWRVSRDHWTFPQAYKEMRQYFFGPQYKELSEAVRRRVEKPSVLGQK